MFGRHVDISVVPLHRVRWIDRGGPSRFEEQIDSPHRFAIGICFGRSGLDDLLGDI